MAQWAAEPGIILKTRVTLRTDCHELSVDLYRCAMASIHSKYVCLRAHMRAHVHPPKDLLFVTQNKSEAGSLSRARLSGRMLVWAQDPEFVTKHPKTTSFSNELN